jgi:amino acid permease
MSIETTSRSKQSSPTVSG